MLHPGNATGVYIASGPKRGEHKVLGLVPEARPAASSDEYDAAAAAATSD